MIFSPIVNLKNDMFRVCYCGILLSSFFSLAQAEESSQLPGLHLKLDFNFSYQPVLSPPAKKAAPVLENSADTGMMETRADVVGEGDQLIITVFGQPDLSADVVVGSMGIITLPLVGAMEVKGKSTMDVAIQFANKLEQGQYLINPKVAVRIGQQISRNFSVFGEVVRPGRFPMQGQLNVLDALSLAGGLTTRADKSVKLLRKNVGTDQEAAEVDTMQIEFESNKNSEKLMQKILPNDVLVVGQQKTFYVYGEVRRPGSYPMEEAMNVMRVLAVGGGVSERGSSSRIVIHRKDKHGELIEMPANIKDVVLPGDVVVVNERIF